MYTRYTFIYICDTQMLTESFAGRFRRCGRSCWRATGNLSHSYMYRVHSAVHSYTLFYMCYRFIYFCCARICTRYTLTYICIRRYWLITWSTDVDWFVKTDLDFFVCCQIPEVRTKLLKSDWQTIARAFADAMKKVWTSAVSVQGRLQGHLAHKKTPPHRTRP